MKRFLALFIFALGIFLFRPTAAFAIDDFTVSNPRVVDGFFAVDINPSPPDNICSWWQQLHFVYLTDSAGNRVGEFGSCGNNPDGTYTFTGGQAGGYLPDTGTYRVEVQLGEFSYNALSSTFDWISPVPHVNRPPSLQLFDSPTPVADLPQYLRVHHNLGETYSVNGSFTDTDSTSWTATVDYGNGEGMQPLSLNGNNFSLSYVYPHGGWYFATVRITDDQGAVGEISRVVTVLDYTLVASNPHIINGGFAVDLRGDLPDNICSWFPAARHDAYVLDTNGQIVGGFSSCSNNPDGSYTVSSGNVGGQTTPPSGTYSIKIIETEQPPYPYIATSNSFVWTAPSPDPVVVIFNSSADTNVRSGQNDRNYGGGNFMRIQSSGDNRALVKFDQSAIQSEIGNDEVLSAKLRVTIVDNGNNWGAGRTVDVHRLISGWVEGDGTENDRGTGNGATWNCAIDSLIENQAKNCSGSTEWEMGQPNNPNVHPWNATATDSKTITNNQTGVVEYDVTADVQSYVNGTNNNYGWLIKKTNEGQNGQVSFGTKESSSIPQLVVTYQP
jgi:hypothetical protein